MGKNLKPKQRFKTMFRNPTHSDEGSQSFMSSDFPIMFQ